MNRIGCGSFSKITNVAGTSHRVVNSAGPSFAFNVARGFGCGGFSLDFFLRKYIKNSVFGTGLLRIAVDNVNGVPRGVCRSH